MSEDGEKKCSICFEPDLDISLPCDHEFHKKCLLGWLTKGPKMTCPVCRDNLGVEALSKRGIKLPRTPQIETGAAATVTVMNDRFPIFVGVALVCTIVVLFLTIWTATFAYFANLFMEDLGFGPIFRAFIVFLSPLVLNGIGKRTTGMIRYLGQRISIGSNGIPLIRPPTQNAEPQSTE